MSKRNNQIALLLTHAPWWISAVFSAVIYMLLAYAVPAWLENGSAVSKGLSEGSMTLAPIFAFLFLFLMLISLIRTFLSGK